MSNLTESPEAWLTDQFEFENCPECGGDADNHDAIPLMGNWFARCKHTYFMVAGYEISGVVEPATHWAWQEDGGWMAVQQWEHDTWWDEGYETHIGGPVRPEVWWRTIDDVPTEGKLKYRDARGEYHEEDLTS